MTWHPESKYFYSNAFCTWKLTEKKINFSDSVKSNSLAFDTENFYHKNISIVCIRHIPGKSFLFSNYVICSLDVEAPFTPVCIGLSWSWKTTAVTVTLRTTSEQCHHNNNTQKHKWHWGSSKSVTLKVETQRSHTNAKWRIKCHAAQLTASYTKTPYHVIPSWA